MSGIEAKIKAMLAEGILGKIGAEQAHEIRHSGNKMAHGDFLAETAEEEATSNIEFMENVLKEVYESPANLDRRKKAREKAKADEEKQKKAAKRIEEEQNKMMQGGIFDLRNEKD